MVREQLVARGIHDARVLAALAAVPRHRFVPGLHQAQSYEDGPLPIGHEQTISQPYIVAFMAQALRLLGNETVLEIGTGSGYGAAVLAQLAAQVFSIERHADLAEEAGARLAEQGYPNVEVLVGDGSQGLPDQAPFQGIVVTAAAPLVPPPLQMQLADGGRLVLPVGTPQGQMLQLITRRGRRWRVEHLVPVMFVPLRGLHGWKD